MGSTNVPLGLGLGAGMHPQPHHQYKHHPQPFPHHIPVHRSSSRSSLGSSSPVYSSSGSSSGFRANSLRNRNVGMGMGVGLGMGIGTKPHRSSPLANGGISVSTGDSSPSDKEERFSGESEKEEDVGIDIKFGQEGEEKVDPKGGKENSRGSNSERTLRMCLKNRLSGLGLGLGLGVSPTSSSGMSQWQMQTLEPSPVVHPTSTSTTPKKHRSRLSTTPSSSSSPAGVPIPLTIPSIEIAPPGNNTSNNSTPTRAKLRVRYSSYTPSTHMSLSGSLDGCVAELGQLTTQKTPVGILRVPSISPSSSQDEDQAPSRRASITTLARSSSISSSFPESKNAQSGPWTKTSLPIKVPPEEIYTPDYEPITGKRGETERRKGREGELVVPSESRAPSSLGTTSPSSSAHTSPVSSRTSLSSSSRLSSSSSSSSYSSSSKTPTMLIKNTYAKLNPNTDPIADSWYTFSPYATTPKFTRLGLQSSGVVLPLSRREVEQRRAGRHVGASRSGSEAMNGGIDDRLLALERAERLDLHPSMILTPPPPSIAPERPNRSLVAAPIVIDIESSPSPMSHVRTKSVTSLLGSMKRSAQGRLGRRDSSTSTSTSGSSSHTACDSMSTRTGHSSAPVHPPFRSFKSLKSLRSVVSIRRSRGSDTCEDEENENETVPVVNVVGRENEKEGRTGSQLMRRVKSMRWGRSTQANNTSDPVSRQQSNDENLKIRVASGNYFPGNESVTEVEGVLQENAVGIAI